MNRATAIIVFLCLLMQCMARYVATGYYQLNKDYIAKNLCENRDKPQLKCCGKCYLRKQLKKAAENESPSGNAPTKVEKYEVAAFVLPALMGVNNRPVDFPADAARTPVFQHLHHSTVVFSVFHPPSIIC